MRKAGLPLNRCFSSRFPSSGRMLCIKLSQNPGTPTAFFGFLNQHPEILRAKQGDYNSFGRTHDYTMLAITQILIGGCVKVRCPSISLVYSSSSLTPSSLWTHQVCRTQEWRKHDPPNCPQRSSIQITLTVLPVWCLASLKRLTLRETYCFLLLPLEVTLWNPGTTSQSRQGWMKWWAAHSRKPLERKAGRTSVTRRGKYN